MADKLSKIMAMILLIFDIIGCLLFLILLLLSLFHIIVMTAPWLILLVVLVGINLCYGLVMVVILVRNKYIQSINNK